MKRILYACFISALLCAGEYAGAAGRISPARAGACNTEYLNTHETNRPVPVQPDGYTPPAGNETAGFRPSGLRCEYLENPLGLDVPQPRLSWRMETAGAVRGKRQTAYRILVAGSEESLATGRGDLWDSGRVYSGESVNRIYGGKLLEAGQPCFWKVSIADERGVWSPWSAPARWRMGLFAGDWTACWMGSAETEALNAGGRREDNRMADPWFRKTVVLETVPADAVAYVASIGYHELYVNGKKVGDAVLSPSVTDHLTRARYMTYEIAAYLQPGENVLALWVGASWAVFPAYQRADKPAVPMALFQAELAWHSGARRRIVSDATWKTYASPNTLIGYWEAHHFGGERYDAACEMPGWNDTGFDDSGWAAAKVYAPAVTVSADRTEPNRLLKEIHPAAVEEVSPGIYRVDMGINYAGWFEMQVEGEPGDSVLFEFAEKEKSVCNYGLHSVYRFGTGGKGVFCNRFNYMAGRWVRVTGLRRKPELTGIRGWMIRPDYRRAGGFGCDIPLLDSVYRTAMWTFENLSLGNYVVDCPHRERCGYGGDAMATTRMALGNYGLEAFYAKWMEDWRDVQAPDGNVPYTAPTRIGGGGPAWSGFCVTLPWEFYRQYGDRRALAESFPSIRRWLAFVETKAQRDMLVRWGGKWSFLGDWLWPDAKTERAAMEKRGKALGDTPETLFFNNCHWIYSLQTAARIADVLERDSLAAAYRKRAAQVRQAVHAAFFNLADASYVNGYPAYLAIALSVDLPPEGVRPQVWKRLEHEIRVTRKGHFWGGITAGSFLLHTLLDYGRNDLIFEMATKEGFPGWGDMLRRGSGTFFEDWEGRGSALHSSYLYIGSWFIEALGGIRRPDAGYREFVIVPWISPEGPKRVRSHYDSPYGRIVSNWSAQNGRLVIEVSVPPNTAAVLKLPPVCLESVEEGGKAWREAEGVKLHQQAEQGVSFALQPGTYRFEANLLL